MKQLERNLLIVTLALSAVGIVMVYSTTAIYAREYYGDSLYYFRRELIFVALGLVGLVAARMVGVDRLQKVSLLGILTAVGALLLLLAVGHEAGGAKRWFRLLGFSFQPIEMVKPLVILYMADYLSRRQSSIKTFRNGFLPVSCVLGLVVALVLLQPDLGSAVLLSAVAASLFFVAGIRFRYLAATLLSALPLLLWGQWLVAWRQ